MHVIDGHSLAETASVIRAHVLAMFLPSLLTAPLISLFGTRKLMLLGVLAMLTTLVLGLQGQQVMHYWWALVLLGIGWNFLFIGGTTLLVRTYQPAERFKAQAFNDFSVFAASAAASLLAGALLYLLGWQSVLITALPLLVVMLLILLWSLRLTPDSQPVTTTA
jgi:MFS family permease